MTRYLKQKYFLGLLFVLVMIMGAARQSYPLSPTGSGAFSRIPLGARAMALGGAFVAVADDASTFYHNPAGAAKLSWSYLSLHGQKHLMDDYLESISFIHSPGEKGNWAFGVAAYLFTPTEIESYNSLGNAIDTPLNYSGLGYVTVARKFGKKDGISIGLNGKFITENLGSVSSTGGGVDLGILMPVSFIDIGMMIQDVFTIESFDNRTEPVYFDRILKVGFATNISEKNNWKIAFQFDKNLSHDSDVIVRVGLFVKLWQGKGGKIDYNLRDLSSIEESFKKILEDKKDFDEAIYLNMGYGDGFVSSGLSMNIWRLKIDLTASLSTLDWNSTIFLANIDIPLY